MRAMIAIKSRSLDASIAANNIGPSISLLAENANQLLPLDLHRPDICKRIIQITINGREIGFYLKKIIKNGKSLWDRKTEKTNFKRKRNPGDVLPTPNIYVTYVKKNSRQQVKSVIIRSAVKQWQQRQIFAKKVSINVNLSKKIFILCVTLSINTQNYVILSFFRPNYHLNRLSSKNFHFQNVELMIVYLIKAKKYEVT